METIPRTPEEHRSWWQSNTSVPYGYCWCGCGQQTNIAPQSHTAGNRVKGEPCRLVAGHRVHPNRRTSVSKEAHIHRRYATGESSTSIATDYGLHFTTVLEIVKRNGGTVRSTGGQRKYTCNHSYFDNIDTEDKAYWLGFIVADGCVYQNVAGSKLVTIVLSTKDEEHLSRFLLQLEATHPIRHNKRGSGYSERATCRVDITSQQLYDSLAKHGATPRKTFTAKWPDFLPRHLARHYLRGYSDGDGYFGAYSHSGHADKSPKPGWGIIGTEAMCEGVRRFLVNHGVHSKARVRQDGRNPRMSTLSYRGTEIVGRIYYLLYQDATVWLPRKRDKVAHLL